MAHAACNMDDMNKSKQHAILDLSYVKAWYVHAWLIIDMVTWSMIHNEDVIEISHFTNTLFATMLSSYFPLG